MFSLILMYKFQNTEERAFEQNTIKEINWPLVINVSSDKMSAL